MKQIRDEGERDDYQPELHSRALSPNERIRWKVPCKLTEHWRIMVIDGVRESIVKGISLDDLIAFITEMSEIIRTDLANPQPGVKKSID